MQMLADKLDNQAIGLLWIPIPFHRQLHKHTALAAVPTISDALNVQLNRQRPFMRSPSNRR
jgi:hypothetical protein